MNAAKELTSMTGFSSKHKAKRVVDILLEDQQVDYDRYHQIQRRFADLLAKGKGGAGSPEIQALWKENEEIKNRYGGMPPPRPE